MTALLSRDGVAGLLFAAIGLAGLWIGRDLPMGTADEMGTGYVPRLMCWLLAGFGVLIVLGALRGARERVGKVAWQPLLTVTLGVLVFAATLERLGALVAVLLTVVVTSFAGERGSLKSIATAAIVLALAVTAIFVWGLGLPVPTWPKLGG